MCYVRRYYDIRFNGTTQYGRPRVMYSIGYARRRERTSLNFKFGRGKFQNFMELSNGYDEMEQLRSKHHPWVQVYCQETGIGSELSDGPKL